MKQYELLYILGGHLTDQELVPHRSRAEALLTAQGATITRNEYAGKVKLAYPIREHRFGHYIIVWFSAEPTVLAKLNAEFELDNDVVRHMIVDASEVNPLTATFSLAAKPEDAQRPAHPEVEERPVVAPPSAPAPELTSEDLDKKIEEILTEEVK